VNPTDFLKLAEELCLKDDAASLRSAISRAYFASLLFAKRYINIVEKKPHVGEIKVHQEVKNYLSRSPDVELNELGDELKDLQDCRVAADYKMDDDFSENRKNAEDVFLRAEEVISTISKKTGGIQI